MLKNILAIIIGVLAGGSVIALIEVWLIHQLFEMPSSMIPNDASGVSQYMSQIPLGAKVAVVISQALGALTATAIAAKISHRNKKTSILAGAVLLGLSIANLISISHPIWMDAAIPLGSALAIWLGARNTY